MSVVIACLHCRLLYVWQIRMYGVDHRPIGLIVLLARFCLTVADDCSPVICRRSLSAVPDCVTFTVPVAVVWVIVDLALKGFLVGRRECKLCAAVIAVVDLCIAANQFVALLRQPVLQTDRESALQYYTGWEYLAYTTLALDHFPVVEVTIQSRSS